MRMRCNIARFQKKDVNETKTKEDGFRGVVDEGLDLNKYLACVMVLMISYF